MRPMAGGHCRLSGHESWNNEQYYNFGCAYQNALANQVSDPIDLAARAHGRPHRHRSGASSHREPAGWRGSVHEISFRRAPPSTGSWGPTNARSASSSMPSRKRRSARFARRGDCATPRISDPRPSVKSAGSGAAVDRRGATDRRMARTHLKVHMGGAAAALEAYGPRRRQIY